MTTEPTGRVIQLNAARHEDVQALLPWYVTGRLEPGEQALVEAHVGKCAECQADVGFQKLLSVEIAALPVDAEPGWQAMRRRLEADTTRRVGTPLWRAWAGWAAAGGVLLVATGAMLLPATRTAAYHALGAAPVAEEGNLVVIFRPETREQDLRTTLRNAGVRVVYGPTVTDGYVLHVEPAARAASLARLRAQPDVVLAEPIGDNP